MAKQPGLKKRLNPANVQLLLQDVYNQSSLKTAITDEISSSGLADFIKKQFRLTPHQKNELDTIKDRDIENVFNKSIMAALSRNGKIELINEGYNPPNMNINFYAKKTDGGYEVGVKITC